jgi:hypothetical protein
MLLVLGFLGRYRADSSEITAPRRASLIFHAEELISVGLNLQFHYRAGSWVETILVVVDQPQRQIAKTPAMMTGTQGLRKLGCCRVLT